MRAGIVLLVLLGAAVAWAQPAVQTTRDGAQTLLSKDVGDERWAIVHDPATGVVTGNVFQCDGQPPAFVWCETTSTTGTMTALSCFGATACDQAPCTPAEWTPLGPVTLPDTFFLPPGGTAQPTPTPGAECVTNQDCIDQGRFLSCVCHAPCPGTAGAGRCLSGICRRRASCTAADCAEICANVGCGLEGLCL